MKIWASIVILLFVVFGSQFLSSESKPITRNGISIGGPVIPGNFTAKTTSDQISVDSGNPEDNPFSKKGKRGKRALMPIFVAVHCDWSIKLYEFSAEVISSYQSFYFFRLPAGKEDRGPPSLV